MEIEGSMQTIYANVRPGVTHFLEKMYNLFEIVIFTASVPLVS